jgi:hypothetical protein
VSSVTLITLLTLITLICRALTLITLTKEAVCKSTFSSSIQNANFFHRFHGAQAKGRNTGRGVQTCARIEEEKLSANFKDDKETAAVVCGQPCAKTGFQAGKGRPQAYACCAAQGSKATHYPHSDSQSHALAGVCRHSRAQGGQEANHANGGVGRHCSDKRKPSPGVDTEGGAVRRCTGAENGGQPHAESVRPCHKTPGHLRQQGLGGYRRLEQAVVVRLKSQ